MVFLTGGVFSFYSASVTKYGLGGFIEDLPSLITGRKNHGCAGYYDNGFFVLVVVGGISATGCV